MPTEQQTKKPAAKAGARPQAAKAARPAAKAPVKSSGTVSAKASSAKKSTAAVTRSSKKPAEKKAAPVSQKDIEAKKAQAAKKAQDEKKALEKLAMRKKKQEEMQATRELKLQEKQAAQKKKLEEQQRKKAEKEAKAEQRRKERAEKEPSAFVRTLRNTYKSTMKNTVDSKEKKRFPVLIVTGAVITTMLFMVIVASFMQISQIQGDMKRMEATIRELKDEERKLQMELEGRHSSNIIADAADMGFVNDKNRRPIYLGDDQKLDTEEIVEEETKEQEKKINSLMSAFSRSFKKFLEFID